MGERRFKDNKEVKGRKTKERTQKKGTKINSKNISRMIICFSLWSIEEGMMERYIYREREREREKALKKCGEKINNFEDYYK